MKKELIWLHIGMHKTGTSALQQALSGYDDGVSRYARLGHANHSLALSQIYSVRDGTGQSFGAKGFPPLLLKVHHLTARLRMARELSGPAPRLIFSAEALCRFDLEGLAALHRHMAPATEGFRVLIYLREPMSYSASAFQQRVKSGASRMEMPRLSYRARLRHSVDIFGRPAIEAAVFDRKSLGPAGIIGDAARRMGLDPAIIPEKTANEGLSAGATALLYFWNRTPAGLARSLRHLKARAALLETLAQALPGRLSLTRRLVQPQVAAEDLDWLFRRFDIDFRDSLRPGADAAEAITGEADLDRLRHEALPVLVDHLEKQGFIGLPSGPDAVMDRLFAHHLRQTPWRPF